MKKKYSSPQINPISLDKNIVLLSVSDPNYDNNYQHGQNVHDNVQDTPFGGNSPFPNKPQY
jgi:hypothetical protein